MLNIDNFGMVDGRLTEDPVVFTNSDGSRKVRIKVAVQDNYMTKDNKRGTQFIPLEAFVPADKGLGLYENMGEGDKVKAEFSLRNNNYTDKDGVAHYELIAVIDSIKKQEPKSVTDARKAAKAQEAAAETAE